MQNRTSVRPVVMMRAPVQSGPPGTLALVFLGAVQIVQKKAKADKPARTAKIPLHLIGDNPVGRPPKIVPIADPRGAPALKKSEERSNTNKWAARERRQETETKAHASVKKRKCHQFSFC